MKFFKSKKKADVQEAPTESGAVAAVLVSEESGETAEDTPAAVGQEQKRGILSRLRSGLGRTSDNLVQGLGNLFLGRKEIDAELFEQLESRLLLADVGVEATVEIIKQLTQRVSRKELTRPESLQAALPCRRSAGDIR